MFFQIVWKILGSILFAFSVTLLVPLFLAIYYEYLSVEPFLGNPSFFPFLYTLVISLAFAFFFSWLGKEGGKGGLYRKEGLISVVLIWICIPAIASLPYLFSGTLHKPTQAYFEAVSGLTTTGVSVIYPKKFDSSGKEAPYETFVRGETDVLYTFYGTVNPILGSNGQVVAEGLETLGKPLLFWRSLLQWVGGLGIIVLFIAILPALGVGGKILFQTEMPGPLKETLTPRLKEAAATLWKIYVGLTIVQILLLKFASPSISWFDAVTISFSTLSTGGLGVTNEGIASYQSPVIEWILIVFMILGGMNFSLYYYCLRGKFYRLHDTELFVYLSLILLSGFFVAYQLVGTTDVALKNPSLEPLSWSQAIRAGFFHTISAQTSTGFATMNYDKWPYVVQVLLLLLMYVGGMSGSTAGGIKVMRQVMIFRIIQDKIELMFRPEALRSFQIGEHKISKDIAITVLCFVITVVAIGSLGTLLLCLDGIDPETSFCLISSLINNAGLGFRGVGPTDSFAFLSDFGLILSSIWMILGRLEFFAVLVILVPSFWREF